MGFEDSVLICDVVDPILNKILIENRRYGPMEVWHAHKDGTEFPMLMSGIVINDDTGSPKYLANGCLSPFLPVLR